MTLDEAVARFGDAAAASGETPGSVMHAVFCCGEALDAVCVESGHVDPDFMHDVSYTFGLYAFMARLGGVPLADVFGVFVGFARSGLRGWERNSSQGDA